MLLLQLLRELVLLLLLLLLLLIFFDVFAYFVVAAIDFICSIDAKQRGSGGYQLLPCLWRDL